MKNTHDYTPEEILDALEMLKNEYNSAPLYALMHGVPQLVKRLREAEADAGVNLQALTTANRAYAELLDAKELVTNVVVGDVDVDVEEVEAAANRLLATVPPEYMDAVHAERIALSQPDGHADVLDHLKEYGGGSD